MTSIVTYHVDVRTGDQYLAGTDSNIFLTLFGELGTSDEFRLNGRLRGNAFERGRLDSLDLAIPDIGRIQRIDVRSDNAYAGSGWLLARIDIARLPADGTPAATPSVFRYNGWIENTSTRTITEATWPWPCVLGTVVQDPVVVRQVTPFDLLRAEKPLERVVEVEHVIREQVELTHDVTETSSVSATASWTSPDLELGSFSTEFKTEWQKVVQDKRVDTGSQEIRTRDERRLVIPARRLTLIETRWTESWVKGVASIGSTHLGLRWLETPPALPGWSVRSFRRGELLPADVAEWLKLNRPDLVKQFRTAHPWTMEAAAVATAGMPA